MTKAWYYSFTKVSFVLGQVRDTGNPYTKVASLMFPPNLAPDYLYPEASVIYTQDDDGSFLDVACFAPEVAEVQKVTCRLPFVNPLADDHLESCIQPCPVQAYTDDEYTLMWGFSNAIGVVGLTLNVFMAATWAIGSRKEFSALPYQLKVCVFAGVLYGLVGTLPSLVMKYELPCACETEEWYNPCFCMLFLRPPHLLCLRFECGSY
jgi:hypothetical protein